MNDTQRFFLRIMADHLLQRETVCQTIDWEAVYTLSKMNEVSALVYHQCKSFMPKENPLKGAYAHYLFDYAQRKRVIEEFKKTMAPFDFVFFKGAVLAELYPMPAFRSMGDVDVLIHQNDRDRVDTVLTTAGFQLKYREPHALGTWHYEKNGILFEVHVQIVHEKMEGDLCYPYFCDIWNHIENGYIEPEAHLLFLLVHMKEHMMEKGIGFRQFLDVAVMEKQKVINWKNIAEDAKKIGCSKLLENVLAFNMEWFGIPSPIVVMPLDNAFFMAATEKIFADGVFGYNNEDNVAGSAAIAVQRYGWMGRILLVWKGFFQPYRNMILIPEMQFLVGKKYLLPFAWVYRVILRRKDLGRIKERYLIEGIEVKKRNDLLKQWGVIE